MMDKLGLPKLIHSIHDKLQCAWGSVFSWCALVAAVIAIGFIMFIIGEHRIENEAYTGMMQSRYVLVEAFEDYYEQHQVELVYAKVNPDGSVVAETIFADDQGSYYWIPKFSRAFNLATDHAVVYFYGGVLWVSLTISLLLFYLLYASNMLRIGMSLSYIFFAKFLLGYHDVYTLSIAMAVIGTPAALLVTRHIQTLKRIIEPKTVVILSSVFILGLVAAYANNIRSHAGTVALILLFLMLIGVFWKHKTVVALVLVCFFSGSYIANWHIKSIYNARDQYLEEHQANVRDNNDRAHPFWHAVYLGLAYVENPWVPEYNDTVASNKVNEIAKARNITVANCSVEYEQILKEETLSIAKNHPGFFFECYFAKVKSLFLRFMKYGWIGFVFWFIRWPKRFWEETAIFATILFGALPGILVIPYAAYVAAMTGMLAIFIMYNICETMIFLKEKHRSQIDADESKPESEPAHATA